MHPVFFNCVTFCFLEPVLATSSPSAAGRRKNIVTVSYLHSKCNLFMLPYVFD